MLSRIAKLWLYIRAPVKTFVVLHPIRALKLFLAFLLGKALFGRRRKVAPLKTGAAAADTADADTAQSVTAPALEAAPSEPPVAVEAAALDAAPEADPEASVTG